MLRGNVTLLDCLATLSAAALSVYTAFYLSAQQSRGGTADALLLLSSKQLIQLTASPTIDAINLLLALYLNGDYFRSQTLLALLELVTTLASTTMRQRCRKVQHGG